MKKDGRGWSHRVLETNCPDEMAHSVIMPRVAHEWVGFFIRYEGQGTQEFG